jgi:hypothetical protein
MQLGLVPAFFTKQTIAPKHDLMQAATDLLQAANVPWTCTDHASRAGLCESQIDLASNVTRRFSGCHLPVIAVVGARQYRINFHCFQQLRL